MVCSRRHHSGLDFTSNSYSETHSVFFSLPLGERIIEWFPLFLLFHPYAPSIPLGDAIAAQITETAKQLPRLNTATSSQRGLDAPPS